MPDELLEILVRTGVRDVRLSGPGALARSIPNEVLRMLLLMITAGDFSTCATSSTRTRPYAAWGRTTLQLRGCVRATLDRLDGTRGTGCLITASVADRPTT